MSFLLATNAGAETGLRVFENRSLMRLIHATADHGRIKTPGREPADF